MYSKNKNKQVAVSTKWGGILLLRSTSASFRVVGLYRTKALFTANSHIDNTLWKQA